MYATAPVSIAGRDPSPAGTSSAADTRPQVRRWSGYRLAGPNDTPPPVAEPTPFPVSDLTRQIEIRPARATDVRPILGPLTDPRSTRPAPDGPRPPARFPAVGDTFCGFKLVGELGSGAFARVYLAEQTALASRRVALKVTTRPTREPQQLAKLRHTNVVPIYSVHDDPPLQAVCMPYLGRRTLADLVKEYRATGVFPGTAAHSTVALAGGTTVASSRGSGSGVHPALPPGAAAPAATDAPEAAETGHPALVLWLVAKLADGLAHAHEVGILHLDLKPANVLLADDGQPLLLDFNLAYDVRAGDRERAGGTLPYMAPEQLDEYLERGPTRVDHRTDLYALGVIAFELLTGRHPFPVPPGGKANPAEMAKARRQGPPPVRPLNPAVSPAVESIVRTLLQPDPDRRYQSARDLLIDLDRHRQNLPLRFAPDRCVWERVRKWRRRHPRLFVHSLLAAAVLTSGGVAYAAFREHYARSAAAAGDMARAVRGELAKLRVGLASRDDVKGRAAALDRGRAVLAAYGLPGADWSARPAVRILPESERAALGDDLGELALLMAHAEWLNGLGKPDAERAAAAERALAWNRAAETCYAGRTAPAAVAAQRRRLAAGADPDPKAGGAAAGSDTDLYLRAAELMAVAAWRSAAKPLEELTARDPAHFAGQYCLADCRRETGELTSALERYQVAQALAPADPRPAYHRGRILATQAKADSRKYAAAEAQFTDAIRRDPAFADAYRERAVVRTAPTLGDNRGALEDLNEALEHGAAPVQVYLLRAMVHDRLGDRAAAERDRRTAAGLTPTEPVDFVIRGLTRQESEPAAALADFRKAAELNPNYLAAWRDQARVLWNMLDQPAKALEAQQRAVACNRDSGLDRAKLAVYLARLGRRNEAHREAQAALALSADPGVVYVVACAYARTAATHADDRPRALGYLRQALRSGYRDFRTIDSDPDLEAIRDLPEFDDAVQAARTLTE
jgi:serine/threonine protein kinase/Tfp pilus assembly protein PilF